MNTNSGLRWGVILALSIVVLMMSSSMAIAQDASITEPGQEIDYTRELIEVDKNIEEGKISLKLGEAEMFVSYGNFSYAPFNTTKFYFSIYFRYYCWIRWISRFK